MRPTLRIERRLNLVQQLHIADVVDVDPLLKDNDESPPVELDGEDGRRELELADGRLSLHGVVRTIRE